jgi:hypothetical protein
MSIHVGIAMNQEQRRFPSVDGGYGAGAECQVFSLARSLMRK